VTVSGRKRVTWLGAALLALVVLDPAAIAGAQGAGPGRRGATAPARAPVDPPPADLPLLEATVDPELERTKAQVESLQQLVRSTLVPMGVLVAALAAGGLLLGAAGGLGALALVWRARRERAPAAEPTALLEATQRALLLVHETLRLARDATERAVRLEVAAVTERAATLEVRARGALDLDLPELLEDPRRRRQIAAVAREIDAADGHHRLHDVEWPAACLVALGLARYLDHDPEAALEHLRAAARREPDGNLGALAHAGTGVILAEGGRFAEAADAFRRAVDVAPPGTPACAELRRRRLESAFFGTAPDAAGAADELDQALARLEADAAEAGGHPTVVRERIATTRGDLLAWAARHAAPDGRRLLLDRALASYRRAGDGAWAHSGLLEARHALGEAVDAADYRTLIEQTVQQIAAAREPRVLAGLHALRLIAQGRLGPSRGEVEAAYRDVHAALRDVDHDVTVASPLERRPVSRDAFAAETRASYRAFGQPLARPVAGNGGDSGSVPTPPAGPSRYAKAAPKSPRVERPGARRGLPG